MKIKVLITGSNGLLGQKLVELISSHRDVNLIATARGGNRLPGSGYSFRVLDITNKDQVDNVLGEEKPDVVIHTAAMTHVDQCELNQEEAWRNNVSAVENLISACTDNKIFLVHVSTDFIFNGKKGPLDEQEEAAPVNFYGETKLAAEKKVMESGINWAIARTVLVYGLAHDMSRSNVVLWVKNSLESGKQIQVVDDQYRTPTLAEDLAMGCWLIAKKQAKGIYNISGENMLTPYKMATLTAEVFGLDKNLIIKTDSSKFTQPAKRPLKTGFIIDKAKKELGYQPKSFIEGLKTVKEQLEKIRNS